MGANDNVHRAGRQIFDHLLLSAASAESGEQLDANGIIGHALAKSVEVLLREDGRRHEHGDLLTVHDGLEGGADADFSFTEADVAANEAVHRFGEFHIGLGFKDGAHLIGSFLVDKGALEFALPGCVGGEGMAGLGFAGSLDGEQLAGDIMHSAFGLGLAFGPTRAAEGVELRARLAGADIFADEVGLGDGHVQLRRSLLPIAGRILDDQTFLA